MARDYYEILEVSRDAPPALIEDAFRHLANEYHPDVNKGRMAPQIFNRIVEAYEVLSDPQRRALYDADLADGERTRLAQSQPSETPLPRMAEARASTGWASAQHEDAIVQLRDAKARVGGQFGKGVAWTVGGAAITWFTYAAAKGGGYYLISWGPILYGGLLMLRAGSAYIQLWRLERSLTHAPPLRVPQNAIIATVLVALLSWWAASSDMFTAAKSAASPTRETAPTATVPASTTAQLPSPTATLVRATTTPLVQIRPVMLDASQIILPFADLPFVGYTVSSDKSCGTGCWSRTFQAANVASTGNYFFSVRVDIFNGNTSAASFVAMQDCSLVDSQGRQVKSREIVAEVVGEGAKACRHDVGTQDNIRAYSYYAANRNVLIWVQSNPSVYRTDAQEIADVVTVARRQFAAIERVAAR